MPGERTAKVMESRFGSVRRCEVPDWAASLGLDLDEHQRAILDPSIRRGILNCCRKWGKSTMIALKAAHFAAHRPGTTVLVVAPPARQSEELLGIAARMLRDLEQAATTSQAKITLKGQDLGECVDPSVLAIAEYVSEPTFTVDAAMREPLFRCSLALRHMESPLWGRLIRTWRRARGRWRSIREWRGGVPL